MDAMPHDLHSENGRVYTQGMAGHRGTYDRYSRHHDICKRSYTRNCTYCAHCRGPEGP